MAYCIQGNYTIQNCLGVGIDPAGYRLDVCGTSNNSEWLTRFQNSDGTERIAVYMAHGGGYGMAIDSTENDSKYIFKAMAGTGGGGGFGSVPVIWAQHDRKVGIGTTSPGYALDVAGGMKGNFYMSCCNATIDGVGPYDYGIIGTGNGAGALLINDIVGARYAVHAGSYNLTFRKSVRNTVGACVYCTVMQFVGTTDTNCIVNVSIANSLGIGTTSPGATLTVTGPNATGAFFQAANDGAGGAVFCRINVSSYPYNSFNFFNGNMGIGAYASLSNVNLQICDGNANGTDDMVRLMQCLPGNHAFYRSQRCGGATLIMGPTRNSGDGCIPSESAIIWTTTNNPIVIGTCGRQRMRFATDGNAVLGGASANIVGFTGTVLTVNGGGNYQGYEVSTSNVTRMTMVSDGNNGYISTRVAGMCLIFEAGAASEKMRIGSDGRVGVGTSSPSYLLHVNGTFYAAGSSIKYKEGICNYDTDSCLFMCLKPVTYQYKDEWQHLGRELKSQSQIGLIAEDVAEVMPELAILVNEEDEKVVRNVDYEKLSVVLLKEVQKLRQEVDELKNNK